MVEKHKILISFLKKANFEIPLGSRVFNGERTQPEVKVKVSLNVIKVNNENNIFEIEMLFEVIAERIITEGEKEKQEGLYMLDMTYSIITQCDTDCTEDDCKYITMVKVPDYVFPDARTIISNMIRDAGFTGLQIEKIDFEGEYKKFVEQSNNQS